MPMNKRKIYLTTSRAVWPEVSRDIHHTSLVGRVEYLVGVLLLSPARDGVLRFLSPDPVIKCQDGASLHLLLAEQPLLRPLHHGLPHLHHGHLVGVPQMGAGGHELTGGDLSEVDDLLVLQEELRHLDTAVLILHSSHLSSDCPVNNSRGLQLCNFLFDNKHNTKDSCK